MHTWGVRFVTPAAVVLMLLAGCASDGSGTEGANGDVTVAPDPASYAEAHIPDPAENDSTRDSVPEEPGFVQTDANTARVDELVSTFETNGITDPATWAAQVIAHRPYAVGDATGRTFDGLRASLADAGLDDLAVEAIIASLSVGP